ncbi:crotonase/enoyl-CoA hydratase family protein [Pseudomaricurvus alkylphenolicus]|jgi:enoyl-CoA hydratase|uniref:crotonase/enoyl-CoA hydratase family protein n=1 Tax=Pseudomaricurvus alkylphenolicus TaxID=1306991 RepID=UPI00142259B6|nr:crotonase/enoyl-CoA hydratase family protein [Pseudomaricurvus alkylphenolicus]NIB40956.1 crotonase/enoyl-CoA hydratase family protein [Pseudomaricurvus alkylphenolicus]
MSEQDSILTERQGDILIVTLNRPHAKNAVDPETARKLAETFVAFDRDENTKVAVFMGAHGTFCAGADLKAVGSGNFGELPDPQTPIDPYDGSAPMGPSYLRLSKPVIGAISGYAVAGGLELSLWCDMRVVEEDTVFGVFCRRWGVPLIDGGTVRLPRLIGHSNAMDLILTGRPVHADEAKLMGLANRVVPNGSAREAAIALAEQITRFPQQCMLNDRRSAYEQWDLSFDKAMANEARLGRMTLESGETVAGAQRFASGRGRGGSFDDL